MNDLVDRLAVEAAVTQAGRSGVGEPEDLGPADIPRGADGRRDGTGPPAAAGPAGARRWATAPTR